MAVNQNGFNSRITSEALETRFRQVFPAQAGAELIQDLYASGVIVPTIDFTAVAQGQFLPENLQTAWDFSTGNLQIRNTVGIIINTPGFWQVGVTSSVNGGGGATQSSQIFIRDPAAVTTRVFDFEVPVITQTGQTSLNDTFVVFLRAGDELRGSTTSTEVILDVWFRQIASVNGVLVNPLGFSF